MTYDRWLLYLLIAITALIAMTIGVNYIVDPAQNYRISTIYPIYFKDSYQRYLNAGLAKNYDYNSIILGTSHIRNFKIYDVEKNLGLKKTIKLTTDGATAYEESHLLKLCLANNKLESILYGLDILSFSSDSKKINPEFTFPIYLYNDSKLNDLKYLLNSNTFIESLYALTNPYFIQKKSKFKLAYMYEQTQKQLESYGKEKMLKRQTYEINKNDVTFEKLKRNFNENFLPLLHKSKNVEYIIFYPPYSILSYKSLQDKKILNDTLKFKKYLFEKLKQFKNIKLYDFQIAEEITHNLNNYSDFTHYNPQVSSWIITQIKSNKYLLNRHNIDKYEKILRNQITAFSNAGVGLNQGQFLH